MFNAVYPKIRVDRGIQRIELILGDSLRIDLGQRVSVSASGGNCGGRITAEVENIEFFMFLVQERVSYMEGEIKINDGFMIKARNVLLSELTALGKTVVFESQYFEYIYDGNYYQRNT